jgi:predicted AAA+ superfamily ATPase
LVNAGLVYKIHRITKPGLPLKAYEDLTAFKIYLSDTAILRRLSLLDPVAISEGNRLFTEFKGSLTENFVLNSIISQFKSMPYYWRSGNEAEVDFIVQFENTIIPIEVKSDQNIKSRSLSVYREKYNPEISIRFSLRNLKKEEGLINLPLFMADYVHLFLD